MGQLGHETAQNDDATVLEAGSRTPVSARELRASYRHCHRVTRRRAGNFYYGLKLTPAPKRDAMYAIYAFMRACDDMVDEREGDQDNRQSAEWQSAALQRIEQFRKQMHDVINLPADGALPEGKIWPAFHDVAHTYQIDPACFNAMLNGQRDDVLNRRYQTFDHLYDYCYKVASTVGLVCLAVWGSDGDPQVKKLAEYRGIAFQLTNILRDLAEDAGRERMYLPQDELERFGYTADHLRRGLANNAFDRLMRYQIERARSYYEMSMPLDRHLTPDCRPTSRALLRIYRGLLERIAEQPDRVLEGRVRLSRFKKAGIAFSAMWQRGRGK